MSNSCCGGSGVTGLCGACGCNPCSCIYQNIFQTGGSGSPATAGQCVNLSGICVLDAYNANTMYFRGVASGTAALSVSLDATNHVILLNLDYTAIVAALPQATTTQAGVGETATDAEAQAKASITVFLTPSNLAALGASTTFAGFLEIATDAEAIAGASTTLAITPSNLAATIAANYGTTVTFADAVARNAAVPAFVGQFGGQQDTQAPYFGNITAAGAWLPIIVGQGNTLLAAGSATNVAFSAAAVMTFSGSATEEVGFAGLVVHIGGGATLNLDSANFELAGVIQSDSLLSSDGFGQFNAHLISEFVSSNNTQTGWAVTNPSVSRTLDVSSATLGDVRAVLGTLINDLKAIKLPAT